MTLNLSLQGRSAIVCGASAGIGRAMAEAFGSHGARVTLVARRRDRLEALAQTLLDQGAPGVHVLAADLDDRSTFVNLVADHAKAHGPIHIIVNNTGGPAGGPILDAEEDAFATAFSRHVLVAHGLLKTLLPGMISEGYGRILNVVSTSVREPIPNLGVSNTIRGAMASWAKSVSKELPPGITINNLLPGFTDTERLDSLRTAAAQRTGRTEEQVQAGWLSMIPEARLGRPEELAQAALFLASQAGAYVRGVSLAIDGGRMNSI